MPSEHWTGIDRRGWPESSESVAGMGRRMHMTEVAALPLDYNHTPTWRAWNPDGVTEAELIGQPIIRDIEFTASGDPIVGIGPRMELNLGAGDILPTRRSGAATWEILVEPEHYADGFCMFQEECAIGALAASPVRDEVVSTVLGSSPCPGDGVAWFANTDGSLKGPHDGWEYMMVDDTGLGDIEALCPPVQPIYLPVVGRGWCRKARHVDAVLVLDMSTTMLHPTRDGRPKYAAATDAAASFLSLLDLVPDNRSLNDQAAVVGFNDDAWIEQGLTADARHLQEALGRLSGKIAEGTRLDLALARALDAATGATHPPPNLPVIIFLTDGLPNRVPPAEDGRPETTVLRAADAVKRRGVRLYTIGLGKPDDVDEALLRAMASDPSAYRYAPDGEDLAAIYAELAVMVGCR